MYSLTSKIPNAYCILVGRHDKGHTVAHLVSAARCRNSSIPAADGCNNKSNFKLQPLAQRRMHGYGGADVFARDRIMHQRDLYNASVFDDERRMGYW